MNLPWDTAAKWFGGTFAVVVGIFAMFVWGNAAEGGIRCSVDTTATVRPNVIVVDPDAIPVFDTTMIHLPIPDDVVSRMDSLRWVLAEKDSALSRALWELQQSREDEWRWHWSQGDSVLITGMASYAFCPTNGLANRAVWVDSLIVPDHIIRITERILVETGLDWYWIPVAAIIAFLIGWAV